jgi:hypothetical protein
MHEHRVEQTVGLGAGHDAPSGAHCSWKERESARRAPQRWIMDVHTIKIAYMPVSSVRTLRLPSSVDLSS